MQALLAALAGQPAQIARFLGLIAGSVPIAEFFAPRASPPSPATAAAPPDHPTPTNNRRSTHAATTRKTRLAPTQIAPETFLIHNHQGEGDGPVAVALNTMVIRAAEPVVVDTGMAENRDQYLADVFALVDPTTSAGCSSATTTSTTPATSTPSWTLRPNATLVVNWFMTERMGASLEVPPTRQRWVGDGESFDVGDRMLHAVRPPVFDSPTTRGLFDPTTGVYWASDSFATPMLDAGRATSTSSTREFWPDGIDTFDRYVSPWLDAGRRRPLPGDRRPHRGARTRR